MSTFPPVAAQTPVSAEDRSSAVDFVNRSNWHFETWDVEQMVASFLPDSTTYHFHGTVHGHDGLRRLFAEEYPYLVPGVCRHATNHIVDQDGTDGVTVRYHNLLIRYAPGDTEPGHVGDIARTPTDSGTPAIWIYSPMLDRLRKTADGWKIHERYVGASAMNPHFSPGSGITP